LPRYDFGAYENFCFFGGAISIQISSNYGLEEALTPVAEFERPDNVEFKFKWRFKNYNI